MMSLVKTDAETLLAAITTVERGLLEDEAQHPIPLMHALATQAVLQYWGRPVHAFVPVLALRDARNRLRAAHARGNDAPSTTREPDAAVRPLSVVRAAHQFVCSWLNATHAGSPFAAAAANAAVVWCGASKERAPARNAFAEVATLLMADGGLPLVDPAPYVALVMTMLSVPMGEEPG